jgi:hypothetical protein
MKYGIPGRQFTTDELVAYVKQTALANYESGWDVVVEAFTDEEIAEQIGGAKTQAGALRQFSVIVAVHRERTAYAESEGWL